MRPGRGAAVSGAALAAALLWTEALPVLAPDLRACLDGDLAAFATDAAEAAGRVTVRLWRRGAAEDCVAEAGRVLARQPRPGAPPPEAAATAFFLERRCVDARRVEGPGGAVLGWLAYPAC